MRRWLIERVGIVRLRQIVDDVTHRLAFIPITLVVVALVASQALLAVDRRLGDVDVPLSLSTTAGSSRAIFGTIAGGLITAVTLLLSIMLVAVQLASAEFSPRTLRNWLGDRTLRRAVGIVLATTVFCLMGLRSVRDGGDDPLIPTVTVLVAVVLGVVSLAAMIGAVDHVTRSLQLGTVAQQLVDDTIRIIESSESARVNEQPPPTSSTPSTRHRGGRPSSAAHVVEATNCGWVQQIDESGMLEALPNGARAWIAVVHGEYLTTRSPLAFVELPDSSSTPGDELAAGIRRSVALGPNRTMQQDVGFGVQQLTDIAVRALSPGVNDPQTASDMIVHLGEVLREIWSHPAASDLVSDGRASLHRVVPAHEEYLRAALDPIRRAGRADPAVMAVLAATLRHLRDEVRRRELPGPIEPVETYLRELVDHVDDADWLPRERDRLRLDEEPREPASGDAG